MQKKCRQAKIRGIPPDFRLQTAGTDPWAAESENRMVRFSSVYGII